MAISTRIVCVLIAIASVTDAYPTGAPPFACSEMVPGHPKTTTSGAPPFEVNIDFTAYKPGSIITGSISSVSNVTFRGFLIQARSALNHSSDPIGQFINPVNLTHTQCGHESKQGLTHSNNTDKTSVTFMWKAPDQYEGDIVFKVTVVDTFSVSRFWLNVLSDNVTDCSLDSNATDCDDITTEAPVTGTTPPVTTPKEPSGKIIPDSECGTTKGCFSDCNDDGCSYQITWQASQDKTTVDFGMQMKVGNTKDMWIAAGISPNGRMTESNVIACLSHTNNLTMQSSINVGYTNQVFSNAILGLSNARGEVVDGIIQCTVTRQTNMSDTQFMSLSSKHYLLFGSGPVVSGLIAKHSTIPYKTENMVDFMSTGIAFADTSVSLLIKIHASMMILAWIFFSSVGIVAARHFKDMLAHKLYLGVKAWFLVHRPAMILATLCLIAGFVAIFVELKRFTKFPAGPDYTEAHPFVGTVVAGLTLLNPIMAMFRPSPESKIRYIFNWAHFSVGTSAHIAAIVCIFFGLKLERSRANIGAFYVMIGYAGFFVLIQLIFEVYNCRRKAEQANGYVNFRGGNDPDETAPAGAVSSGSSLFTASRTGPLSATDDALSNSDQMKNVQLKGHGLSGYLLLFHGLVMMGLAGLLIAIICVPIHLV